MDKIKRSIERKLDIAQTQIAEFKEKLNGDVAYTLSWSNAVFAAAAVESVCKSILAAIESGTATLDNIRSTLSDQILHAAKYPPQSTSPTSNLMETYLTAAKAEILSDLEYL